MTIRRDAKDNKTAKQMIRACKLLDATCATVHASGTWRDRDDELVFLNHHGVKRFVGADKIEVSLVNGTTGAPYRAILTPVSDTKLTVAIDF